MIILYSHSKPKNGEICYDPDLYNENDEGGPICLTIDKVEETFFKTEFKNELPNMEVQAPELPEEIPEVIEIIDGLEEDSFDPDSFTAPPFIPKGKGICVCSCVYVLFYRHSRHILNNHCNRTGSVFSLLTHLKLIQTAQFKLVLVSK